MKILKSDQQRKNLEKTNRREGKKIKDGSKFIERVNCGRGNFDVGGFNKSILSKIFSERVFYLNFFKKGVKFPLL